MSCALPEKSSVDGLHAGVHRAKEFRIASAIVLAISYVVSYVILAIATVVLLPVFLAARCIELGWRTTDSPNKLFRSS